MVSAVVSEKRDTVEVKWSDGFKTEFASVWLKDNCPHPRTTHPHSFGRLLLMSDLDPDIRIDQVHAALQK